MKIVHTYSFNGGEEKIEKIHPMLLREIKEVINQLDVSDCRDKESKEKTKKGELLYSPIKMNAKFKTAFDEKGWNSAKRIKCAYESLGSAPDELIQAIEKLRFKLVEGNLSKVQIISEVKTAIGQIPSQLFKTVAASTLVKRLTKEDLLEKEGRKYALKSIFTVEELIEAITPDFTGFREMDAVKEKVGIEVQFGKYAFMVYNVCAKMTIFHKHGIIDHGIEIVPVKSLQRDMSTGVAFFEQFVWDLNERGVSNIDIPVLIIGIGIDDI